MLNTLIRPYWEIMVMVVIGEIGFTCETFAIPTYHHGNRLPPMMYSIHVPLEYREP